MSEYGRYIDPDDGMPRWNLPPRTCTRSTGVRSKMIYEAIRELYADHGAAYVRDRIGTWISNSAIQNRARRIGVSMSPEGWKNKREHLGMKLRRLAKTERARVLRGMKQVTRMKVISDTSKTARTWRAQLHCRYGYLYGEPPYEMLYDENTNRRIQGAFVRRSGVNTEERLHERFGFVFRSVDEEEEEEQ